MSAGMIRNIQAATRGIVEMPANVAAELDAIAKIEADPGPSGTHEAVVAAYAAAIIAGRDPASDKAVATALAHYQLATIVTPTALREYAAGKAGAILREHAEEILDTWADVAAEQGAALAGAVGHLDGTRTLAEQATQALARGPRSSEAWRVAQTATATLDKLAGAASLLLTEIGRARVQGPQVRVVWLAPTVSAEVLAVASGAGAWELAGQHGQTLTGASMDAYHDALDRLDDERAAAEATFEADHQNQITKAFRIR